MSRLAHAWLRNLCGIAAVAKPFGIVIRGVAYDCASDGHAALLVKGRSFAATKDRVLSDAIRSFTAGRPWRSGVIEGERLRAWAGSHAVLREVMTQVRVLGVTLDAKLLARYLPPDVGVAGPVRVSAAGRLDVVRFEHADWKLFVMPMHVTELPVNEDPKAKVARRG